MNVPGPPTGVVFNGIANDFKVDAGTGLLAARFIFATDDGQIAGWNGVGTNAISVEPPSDDIYLGLAIADNGAGQHLYVANFNHSAVEVLDSTFQEVDLSGDFTDPGLPARLLAVQRDGDQRLDLRGLRQAGRGRRRGAPRRGPRRRATSTTSTATSSPASRRSAS